MIKLHASYSRKIPGQQEYSSESASAAVEIDLADNEAPHIQTKAHELWQVLKQSVERQLSGGAPAAPPQTPAPTHSPVPPPQYPNPPVPPQNNFRGNGYHGGNGNGGNGRKAGISDKQLKFVRGLVGELKPLGVDFPFVESLCHRLFQRRLEELDRAQASNLIGHLGEIKAGRMTVQQAAA